MKLQFTSTNVQPHPTTTQYWIGPLCVVNKQLEKENNRADLLTAFVFVFSLQIILILSYLIYVLFSDNDAIFHSLNYAYSRPKTDSSMNLNYV